MLAESEERFRAVFEGATDGIIAADPENQRFVFANPRMGEITGYPLKELIKLGVADIHPKKELPYVNEQFTKQAEEKITLAKNIPVLRKDKQVIYCDVSSSPMAIGKQQYLIGFFRDITERKKATESLGGAFDELSLVNEKINVVGKLTRHDVRNKLSAVTGNIYLAKQKLPSGHDALKYLKKTELSLSQIEAIFDFARHYEQLGTEELSPVDVGKSFEKATLLHADLSGIEVINNCGGTVVIADSLLATLFYTLIDNSLMHGKKVTKISVYCETGKDGLKLVYEDDGVGVPEAEKKKIFGKGYGKGTGVGLHMITVLCNIYGWTIKETGKPGKGARFEMVGPKTKCSQEER